MGIEKRVENVEASSALGVYDTQTQQYQLTGLHGVAALGNQFVYSRTLTARFNRELSADPKVREAQIVLLYN